MIYSSTQRTNTQEHPVDQLSHEQRKHLSQTLTPKITAIGHAIFEEYPLFKQWTASPDPPPEELDQILWKAFTDTVAVRLADQYGIKLHALLEQSPQTPLQRTAVEIIMDTLKDVWRLYE